MLFASSIMSAVVMLSGVIALPQPEQAGLMGRASSNPCPAGSYRFNSTACAYCPAGSYCDGKSGAKKLCDYGTYQPNVGAAACMNTTAGYFTNQTGSTAETPCPQGSYQPYPGQKFCYGAPKGRFQSQSGKAFVCGTCCGWAAPLVNNNVYPVNCTGSTPNAYPSSGDGCISRQTNCMHAATCQQSVNGTCPAETFRG